MNKFLKYSLKILGLLLVMMFVLDVIYTKVIEKSIPRNKIRYAMSIKNKHYNVLFLGSSRVENSIVSAMFKENNISVLNMGLEGAVLGDNLLMLQLLNNNNVTFDKIFIQLDYLYNLKDTSFSQRSKSNLLPLIREEHIKEILQNKDDNFIANYYIPFYRYMKNDYSIGFREFINSTMNKSPRISFENGYTPKFGSLSLENSVLPKTIVNSSKVYQEINDLCLKMGVKPIYFISPFCSKLIDNDFVEKLDSIVENFYDYSRTITDDNKFYNCSHLNDAGAKEFTKIIINEFYHK